MFAGHRGDTLVVQRRVGVEPVRVRIDVEGQHLGQIRPVVINQVPRRQVPNQGCGATVNTPERTDLGGECSPCNKEGKHKANLWIRYHPVIFVANDLPTWELKKHAIEHELRHVSDARARLFQAKSEGETIEGRTYNSYGHCMMAVYLWRSRTLSDLAEASRAWDRADKVKCPPAQGK